MMWLRTVENLIKCLIIALQFDTILTHLHKPEYVHIFRFYTVSFILDWKKSVCTVGLRYTDILQKLCLVYSILYTKQFMNPPRDNKIGGVMRWFTLYEMRKA